MTNRGLLLTMTEPPEGMEEEFNAWYEEEHLPERLSIPGFRSARRWVCDCRAGEGRYLATYELDSAAVLSSPQYLAFFDKPTPWTRRCLGKASVFRRWACEQSGARDPATGAKGLVLELGARPAPERNLPGSLQVRRFVAPDGTPPHIALVELAHDAPPTLPAPGAGDLLRFYRALG